MKAIQVVLDEDLLARLDASEEVKAEGRSAVLRRAAAEYLARRHREAISDQYRKAYSGSAGLGEEYEGWEDQTSCPEDAPGA
jgi:metal-responsive CopG/Arc/MetJ family transcriptional regulator